MAVSDDLSRLSTRAEQAQANVANAKTQARDRIAQDVEHARQEAQSTAAKLRADTATAHDRADERTDTIRQSWNAHVAGARSRIDSQRAKHDAKVAERDAEDAEDYASFAIDFAYSAIEEAEYAVLDAVLARVDADAAEAGTSPS